MRQIKFRGKCMCSDEWVYGDLIHKRHDRDALMIQDENGLGSDVVPESVGQFTGLHDKNGKEVYEGDVLSKDGYMWGVYFEVGAFFISKNGKHDPYDYGVERLNPYTVSGCTVLTNIHDNPELLNE